MKKEHRQVDPAETEAAELQLEALNHELEAAEEQRATLAAREAEAKEKYEQAKADYRRALADYRTLIYATIPDIRMAIDAASKRLAKLKREGSKRSEGPTRDAQGRPWVDTADLKQERRRS